MGYGSDWGLMGGLNGYGVITWLVITIDLILLGVLLWKKISK